MLQQEEVKGLGLEPPQIGQEDAQMSVNLSQASLANSQSDGSLQFDGESSQ